MTMPVHIPATCAACFALLPPEAQRIANVVKRLYEIRTISAELVQEIDQRIAADAKRIVELEAERDELRNDLAAHLGTGGETHECMVDKYRARCKVLIAELESHRAAARRGQRTRRSGTKRKGGKT